MSANIKASTDGTQAIIGVGGVDQMTVNNAGVVTANSFAGAMSGNASSATALATGSTTARTLENRFADVVNVADYGAVGDGVADDTVAIQAAIDAVNPSNVFNGGGIVLFQRLKRYLITAPLVLPIGTILNGNSCMIIARQCDAIKFRNTEPIVNGKRNTQFSKIKIENFLFESGAYSSFTNYKIAKDTTHTGINGVDCAFITITNCQFNFFHRAIWASGCGDVYIENNRFYRCWLGVKTYGNPESIQNPIGPVTQSDHFYIGKNFFDQCVYPIYYNGFGANQGPITIQNNYFFGPTDPLASDGFFMRAGVILEAAKGGSVIDNHWDCVSVYNQYKNNNSTSTFVPNTAAIVIDNNTNDAYLNFSNIVLGNQCIPQTQFFATEAITIANNRLITMGWGVLVKRGYAITIISNTFGDLVSGGIKSFDAINEGAIINNNWFNWSALVPIPPEYTDLTESKWSIFGTYRNEQQRLGIGVNTAPTALLDIATGNGQFTNAAFVRPSTHISSRRASAALGDWLIGQDGNANGTKDLFIYQGGTGNAGRFLIDVNGNTAIGQVIPLSKLHVDGDLTFSSATTATGATAGAQTLPANPVGFLIVNINGTSRKLPYYAT